MFNLNIKLFIYLMETIHISFINSITGEIINQVEVIADDNIDITVLYEACVMMTQNEQYIDSFQFFLDSYHYGWLNTYYHKYIFCIGVEKCNNFDNIMKYVKKDNNIFTLTISCIANVNYYEKLNTIIL